VWVGDSNRTAPFSKAGRERGAPCGMARAPRAARDTGSVDPRRCSWLFPDRLGRCDRPPPPLFCPAVGCRSPMEHFPQPEAALQVCTGRNAAFRFFPRSLRLDSFPSIGSWATSAGCFLPGHSTPMLPALIFRRENRAVGSSVGEGNGDQNWLPQPQPPLPQQTLSPPPPPPQWRCPTGRCWRASAAAAAATAR
jgi:hypothetical protein